jgi:hypothetical protein
MHILWHIEIALCNPVIGGENPSPNLVRMILFLANSKNPSSFYSSG